MAREVTIKVIVKHCVTKDGSNKKFDAYRAVQKDGTLLDCRFRMCVKGIPTENFLMRVNSADINISNKYEYPRLWVSNVLDFMPIEAQHAEDTDDLPF